MKLSVTYYVQTNGRLESKQMYPVHTSIEDYLFYLMEEKTCF